MKPTRDALKDLVGCEAPFYGVCDTYFKLGDAVFHAIMDPDDGYRSFLAAVIVSLSVPDNLTFSREPLSIVTIRAVQAGQSHYPDFDGYEFADAKGHVWFQVGTEDYGGYYPVFRCRYTPPAEEQ